MRILAIINIVMELSFKPSIPKVGLFDRLSTFPAEWSATHDYLNSLSEQISVFYTEQPWPIASQFRSNDHGRVAAYSTVFSLCTQKFSRAEKLYSSYQDLLRKYLAERIIAFDQTKDVLEFYLRLWRGYRRLIELAIKIFCYLDRYYLPDNNLPCLQPKAWAIFEEILLIQEWKKKIFNAYFALLAKRREEPVLQPSDKLFEVSKSFKEIASFTANNLDKELFEAYMRESNLYYEYKKLEWFNAPCPEYIKNMSKLEQNEFVLLAKSIATDTERIAALSACFGSVLIKPYEGFLISKDTGLKHMLRFQQNSNLHLAARLFKSYHNVDLIKKELYLFLRTVGLDMFSKYTKQTQPIVYIRAFAKLYADNLKFVNAAFPAQQFTVQFRNAMESVLNINDEDLDIAENLAVYTDQLFRQLQPSLQKEQEVLNVFECLGSKNVYMNIYEKDLSRRLLENRFRDLKQEQIFVALMKEKCGQLFTQGAEGRIDDYVKAVEFEKEFKTGRPTTKFEYSFKVLSKNHWVSDLKVEEDHKAFDYEWPPEVEGLKLQFSKFYPLHNKNKHLEYLPLLSSATIIFPLSKNLNTLPYCEVTTDILQASMLIFIDRVKQPISMADLLAVFRAEQQLIEKELVPLVGTLLVLNDGVYSINKQFACSGFKINFKEVQSKKPVRKQSINMERDVVMQGWVVKIMKQEKQIDIFSLFEKLKQIIKIFKPSMSLLKESIQKLVEKDYLEKDTNDANVVHYKA